MDKQMLSGHQAGGDKFPDFKNYLPDWNKVKHSCKKVIFIYSKLIFYIGFVSFFFLSAESSSKCLFIGKARFGVSSDQYSRLLQLYYLLISYCLMLKFSFLKYPLNALEVCICDLSSEI